MIYSRLLSTDSLPPFTLLYPSVRNCHACRSVWMQLWPMLQVWWLLPTVVNTTGWPSWLCSTPNCHQPQLVKATWWKYRNLHVFTCQPMVPLHTVELLPVPIITDPTILSLRCMPSLYSCPCHLLPTLWCAPNNTQCMAWCHWDCLCSCPFTWIPLIP